MWHAAADLQQLRPEPAGSIAWGKSASQNHTIAGSAAAAPVLHLERSARHGRAAALQAFGATLQAAAELKQRCPPPVMAEEGGTSKGQAHCTRAETLRESRSAEDHDEPQRVGMRSQGAATEQRL